MKEERTGNGRKRLYGIVGFVLLLLLGAVIHAYEKEFSLLILQALGSPLDPDWTPFANTALFVLHSLLYLGLALAWTASCLRRLLPSRERTYVLAAALSMLLFLLLRTVKFRIADYDETLKRYCWYAYNIPLMLGTTLFMMTALRIRRQGKRGRFDERWLFFPALLLALLVLTNDLHQLAYRPELVDGEWLLHDAKHRYGPVYYLYWAWVASSFVIGLVTLTRARWKLRRNVRAFAPFGVLLLSASGLALQMVTPNRRPLFAVAELSVFCIICIFELCIHYRMIPSNERYGDFFASLQFPAVITDRDLRPVYATADNVDAQREQLSEALQAPVRLDEDTRMLGQRLGAACGFYIEDERELHRMNDRLEEANELLGSENELLTAENELRAQKAQVDSRNRVYTRIAERLYPAQRRVAALLAEADPQDASFSNVMARVGVINAHIKRATNLLLADETVKQRELALALEESCRYLGYCGVRASVARSAAEDDLIDRDTAFALLESFELLIEPLIGRLSLLFVSLDGGLRLHIDCAPPDSLPETPLPAQIAQTEDGWQIRIAAPAEEGGAKR